MKAALAAALVLALVPGGVALTAPAARAQDTERYTPISGEALARLCSAREGTGLRECQAYISGVSDTITTYQTARPENGSKGQPLPDYICVTGRATGPQLRQAYLSWAEQHRDQLSYQASVVVVRAFRDLFPCR